MDSIRLKFENYKGVLYVEASINDELTLDDLKLVLKEVRQDFPLPVDVIWNKSGSYSVSLDVQKAAMAGIPEFRHFVYVVNEKKKRESAEFAVKTYMNLYNTRIAGSREEAYTMLSNLPEANLSMG